MRAVPLLKTMHIPGSDLPNCEGSARFEPVSEPGRRARHTRAEAGGPLESGFAGQCPPRSNAEGGTPREWLLSKTSPRLFFRLMPPHLIADAAEFAGSGRQI